MDYKNIFIKNSLINKLIPIDYDYANIRLYKYEKPKDHINEYEIRNHIDNSIQVKIFERETV